MAFSSPSPSSKTGWISRWRQLTAAVHPLRTRLQQDPYYRFQSYQEVELAASWGFRLDVNRASLDDWLRLPGLSIHQARTLSQLTAAGTQFHCLEDIAAALSLSATALAPLVSVLAFYYYAPTSEAARKTLDANVASTSELAQLPVLSHTMAQAIVAERRRARFRDAAQFQARLGIEPELMGHLLYYLRF